MPGTLLYVESGPQELIGSDEDLFPGTLLYVESGPHELIGSSVNLFPGTLLYDESGPHNARVGSSSQVRLSWRIGNWCGLSVELRTSSLTGKGISQPFVVTTDTEETRAKTSSFFISPLSSEEWAESSLSSPFPLPHVLKVCLNQGGLLPGMINQK